MPAQPPPYFADDWELLRDSPHLSQQVLRCPACACRVRYCDATGPHTSAQRDNPDCPQRRFCELAGEALESGGQTCGECGRLWNEWEPRVDVDGLRQLFEESRDGFRRRVRDGGFDLNLSETKVQFEREPVGLPDLCDVRKCRELGVRPGLPRFSGVPHFTNNNAVTSTTICGTAREALFYQLVPMLVGLMPAKEWFAVLEAVSYCYYANLRFYVRDGIGDATRLEARHTHLTHRLVSALERIISEEKLQGIFKAHWSYHNEDEAVEEVEVEEGEEDVEEVEVEEGEEGGVEEEAFEEVEMEEGEVEEEAVEEVEMEEGERLKEDEEEGERGEEEEEQEEEERMEEGGEGREGNEESEGEEGGGDPFADDSPAPTVARVCALDCRAWATKTGD
eukprot:gene18868-43023_t